MPIYSQILLHKTPSFFWGERAKKLDAVAGTKSVYDQHFDWYCCGTSLELSIDTSSSLSLFSSSLVSDLREKMDRKWNQYLILRQGNVKIKNEL